MPRYIFPGLLVHYVQYFTGLEHISSDERTVMFYTITDATLIQVLAQIKLGKINILQKYAIQSLFRDTRQGRNEHFTAVLL